MNHKRRFGLILGIVAFALCLVVPLEGLGLDGRIAFGIFALAALFWIFEPIPIYATSMLVIFLQVMLLSSQGLVFSLAYAPRATIEQQAIKGSPALVVPLEAIGDEGHVCLSNGPRQVEAIKVDAILKEEAGQAWIQSKGLKPGAAVIADATHRSLSVETAPYSKFYSALASPVIVLFLGGFALAAAAVKFGLDKNIARVLLRPFGTKPKHVCLGLMVCAGALSAFMSNTATTAMMMTVALPIAMGLARDDPFRKGIALAIPIAANIGGIATPIGTPPNAVALAALREQGIPVSFSSWMMMAAPFAIALLVVSWWILLIVFKPKVERISVEMKGSFDRSPKAIATYIVFIITILLWITEKLHGISTTMVAFLPIALLPTLGILEKNEIRGFSWEVLWLVAGGISLGLSMKETGLAGWMIALVPWSALGAIGMVLVFGLVGYALSNLISNTVTATMIMPLAITVGAVLANSGELHLLAAIVSITVIVNCAMILPISTPPNAIAISLGFFETKDMAKIGILIGVIGFALAIVFELLLWPFLF